MEQPHLCRPLFPKAHRLVQCQHKVINRLHMGVRCHRWPLQCLQPHYTHMRLQPHYKHMRLHLLHNSRGLHLLLVVLHPWRLEATQLSSSRLVAKTLLLICLADSCLLAGITV